MIGDLSAYYGTWNTNVGMIPIHEIVDDISVVTIREGDTGIKYIRMSCSYTGDFADAMITVNQKLHKHMIIAQALSARMDGEGF